MSHVEPSEAAIDRVAELLLLEVGLRPESTLRARLRRCIRDEAERLGQDSDGYFRALGANAGLRQSLLNRVTVQETGFFRHPEHFEVLAREILPNLTQPVTIWSAGCANGQEAYSLAMMLDENGINGSVIATDVSTSALERTRSARYSAREIKGLSPERVARHLTPVGGSWEINPALRRRVSTLHHNLIDPVPSQALGSQIVLCRNVLIYFSAEHTRTFLDRVASALPSAWLFLGAAETIWVVGDSYETVRFGDTYAYRKAMTKEKAESAAPPLHRVQRSLQPVPAAPHAPRRGPASKPSPVRVSAPRAGDEAGTIAGLAEAGQRALTEGDERTAVVAFRKWVYLAPDDALAHLHLGLALEALGDQVPARRAFGAARRALLESSPAEGRYPLGGYAAAELHKLLDAKEREPAQ